MRACAPLERKRVGSERGGRYDLRSGSTLIGHHAVKLAHDLNGYRFVSPSLAPHDYTALPEHEIETEVDRYIAWPQQALSYYMGELEIVLAREKAEKPLGAKFNISAFHDAVLELGSVPLPVVTARVDRFITEDGRGPYPDME